ncbi:MAG: GGDEF domain-containing protein [Acetivibrio sp.]
MKKTKETKEKKDWTKLRQIWQVIVLILAFLLVAAFSIQSVNGIRGAARVIHYTGFIGGATQMVVKEEMNQKKNDSLIQLLDEMILMLRTGEGDYEVPILKDIKYQEYLEKIQKEWEKIKQEIYEIRKGKDTEELYKFSEDTYEDTNLASYAAQGYMESYVSKIKMTMMMVYCVFFLLMGLFLYASIKNTKLKSEARDLNRIAYYDPYIGIANKVYCEKKISDYKQNSYKDYLAVIMFDLNNLKGVNDEFGHQTGDKMIRNFSLALDTIGREYGFTGRYGGDEFLALFEECDEIKAKEFIEKLVRLVREENKEAKEPWEKISFAAGYAIGLDGDKGIPQLLEEADQSMYQVKRKMKDKKKKKK